MSRGAPGLATALLLGGAAAAAAEPIADNSFFVEEAYNQGPRVVQHVATFDLATSGGSDATLTFTQEWPAAGLRHQVSYTLGAARVGGASGVGDAALHYRYQLLGADGGRFAVAPRISLLLPFGEAREELGAGAAGIEVNLPLSVELGERWVGHWNAGGSWVPGAESPAGDHADLEAVSLAQGIVFRAGARWDLLLEARWTRGERVVGRQRTADDESFLVSPGLRFAIDRPSGLQIVPGVALPFGVGVSSGERAVFAYLSFEHPF